MSTRSAIAVLMPDGKYTAIYCHWNGYPAYNGKMLAECYDTQEKAEALVALGSISVLDRELAPPAGKHRDFDDRERGYTLAYTRDRGDEMLVGRGKTAKAAAKGLDHAYLYTFANGEWSVSHLNKYRNLPIGEFRADDGEWQDNPVGRVPGLQK